MYKLGSSLCLKSPIGGMSHLCSLELVLVIQFTLTNVKFKKHVITAKTCLVFFRQLVAHRDWGKTIQNMKLHLNFCHLL